MLKKIHIIGLGLMGTNLGIKLVNSGIEVSGSDILEKNVKTIMLQFFVGTKKHVQKQHVQNNIYKNTYLYKTTFSTFGVDALNFLKSAQWMNASLYIGLNVFGTLLSILLGFRFYSLINP